MVCHPGIVLDLSVTNSIVLLCLGTCALCVWPPAATLASDMQKQIAESKKQKAEAERALEECRHAVQALQARLRTAQDATTGLQKQANSVKQQAGSEVKDVKLLEQKVLSHFSHACQL